MSPVSPSTFGLYEDVPEATLDPEWRTLVHQHAHTLAGMLQRLQTVVAEFHRHIDALRLQTLAADAERFLVAQALQHVHLEREQGQRCALATILVLLDKAHQTEDILGPYEPGHRGEDDAYDHNGIAIREEIGVYTQRYTCKQWYELLLLFAIEEVPSADGAEEDGQHQDGPNIHLVSPRGDCHAWIEASSGSASQGTAATPLGPRPCPGTGGDERTV